MREKNNNVLLDKVYSVAPLLIIIFVGFIGYKFSVSDNLAGFSDDSATYLIMADMFSLFSDTPASYKQSYNYFYLPPGFAIVLSLFDTGNQIYSAHILVLLEYLAALAVFMFYSRQILGKGIYLAPVVMFVCIPGSWIEMLKIMSENQYMMLSLVVLLLLNQNNIHRNNSNITYALLIGVLVSFAVLTRTIGISLLPALIVYYFLNYRSFIKPGQSLIAFLFAFLAPVLIWKTYKPDIQHSYIEDLASRFSAGQQAEQLMSLLRENMFALYDAWISNVMIFDNENISIGIIVSTLALFFILIGIKKRILEFDVIYMISYMCILLLWPYSNEMSRFLYPLMPLLLLYLVVGLMELQKYIRLRYVVWPVTCIFILSVSFPALLHMKERYEIGRNFHGENLTHIPELYEKPSLLEATSASMVWFVDLEFISSLKEVSQEYKKMLALKPQFVTYLSHIYAESLPLYTGKDESKYFEYIHQTGASHILLTTIEMKKELKLEDLLEHFSDHADVLFALNYQYGVNDGVVLAILELKSS